MRFSGLLSFLLTGKPFSERELDEVRGEVSFSQAIEAHIAWKQRLVEAVAQRPAQLPPAEDIGKDTLCTLGMWIHGDGQERYGELPSFDELRRQHAEFHRLAREIVELSRADRRKEAELLMSGKFQHTSSEVIARVRHLSGLFGS